MLRNTTAERCWVTVVFLLAFACVLMLTLGGVVHGQPASVAVPTSTPVVVPGLTDKTAVERFKRWFEIDTLATSLRYRLVRDENGVTTGNGVSWDLDLRAHFNFDKKGKYNLYIGVFTGDNIIGGWNNTGIGTGEPEPKPYLKRLFFNAKPVDGIEVRVGGLGMINVGTEITGYDNDAYMTGQRFFVRKAKKAYFDEIMVSHGYLGDYETPNVLNRLKRLSKSNYRQFLVRKTLNKHVSFAAEYTFEGGQDFMRQAVNFTLPKSQFLDSVRFENYQRLDPDAGYGFNIFGNKEIYKNLAVGAGFTRIDKLMINADRFPPGNRIYASMDWKLTREFSVHSMLIHSLGTPPLLHPQRTRFDLIFTFNTLETLRRFKLH